MAEISRTGQFSVSRPTLWLFITSVMAGFVYIYALGLPLLGPDEPRYAQVAREMFERGDLITPTLGGFNWFEKPALLYWLQISAYELLGGSEFAARIGPALFGIATSLCLMFLGIGLRERDAGKGMPLHYWMFAVCATSLGMMVFSRGASFDIILTFPLTAAMTSFFAWYLAAGRGESPRNRLLFLAGFYFFAGLATLAKGLIGVVFPGVTVVLFFILIRQFPRKEFLLSLIWGPVVTLATASSWYLPMYLRHGWGFIDEFFVQHHFERFTSNKYKHPQPFWFFWVVLPLMTIPWLPFFLAGTWRYGKRIASHFVAPFRKAASSPAGGVPDLEAFATAWMLVPLVFFSFSGSKLPGYILPSLPAAAVLTSLYVRKFAARSNSREMLCKGLAFAMFAVVIFLLSFVVPNYADNDSAKSLVGGAGRSGYGASRIAGYRSVDHSLEFYAAGRLFRDEEGKQRVFSSPGEIRETVSAEGGTLLVVAHPGEMEELGRSKGLEVKELVRRGEWVISSVTSRPAGKE